MRTATALFLTLAAFPALAQQPAMPKEAPGAPDPSRVVAGSYAIDTNHTQLLFTVSHFGFSAYTGQFRQPTGTLTIDPANPARDTVDVTFPIDKVATTLPALDRHLASPDFFDAAQFPEGRFTSTKVVANGQTALITGNLTLHGITRPVTLDAHFVGAGISPVNHKPSLGFAATTTIKRSDFGMSLAIPLISDRVDLTVNAAFNSP